MSEKRKDPDDGKAYTLEELAEFYKGKYKKKEIQAYWETCEPVKAKKAKAKAKEKEKAEPKPKAKAKEKAKAKAKAKAEPEPKEPVKRLRVGDKIPDATLETGFKTPPVSLGEICKGKKVVLVGLPGAFTPTWSTKQIPGYIEKEAELKAKGVSDVLCYSVNDGAVIGAWAEAQAVPKGSFVQILGDPTSALTRALGLVLSDKGPMGVLGNPRSKRFSLLVEDGVIRSINVAASKTDPAGDEKPDISLAEKMLEDLDKLEASKEPRPPKVKVGDPIPAVALHKGFPPEMVKMDEFCKGKKVVLVGLPGAFTPTWCTKQVPGYLAKQDELKAKGVSDVVVYCVNDGAVMAAWGKKHGIEGSMLTFMGDPGSKLSRALGLTLGHPGVVAKLGNPRCKRFSMLLDDGVIKSINVACAKDDPAGDSAPEVSMVDKMLEDLSA